MPRRNIRPDRAPAAVRDICRALGANLTVARRRRRQTQEELARRAGVSRVTLAGVEAGRLGTGVGAYVAVLWALGLERDVARVASPDADGEAAVLDAARLGRRVRPARSLDDDF